MRYISLDIETLDTDPTARILSIGAVSTEDFSESFYFPVDSSEQRERTVSATTLEFWTKPENIEEFTRLIRSGIHSGNHLSYVLFSLIGFIEQRQPCKIITRGKFDIEVLEHAYRQAGLTIPWDYRDIIDLRTGLAMFHLSDQHISFEGQKHNALDDAKHQAKLFKLCQEKMEMHHPIEGQWREAFKDLIDECSIEVLTASSEPGIKLEFRKEDGTWSDVSHVDGPISENPLDRQVGGGHYKKYKIQPIEFFMANQIPVDAALTMRYILRHQDKNGAQDLDKAIHLLEIMKQHHYGDKK